MIFICYRFRRSVSLIPHPQWVRGRRGGERLPLFDNTELILSHQTGGARNGKAISKEIWNVVCESSIPRLNRRHFWSFAKPLQHRTKLGCCCAVWTSFEQLSSFANWNFEAHLILGFKLLSVHYGAHLLPLRNPFSSRLKSDFSNRSLHAQKREYVKHRDYLPMSETGSVQWFDASASGQSAWNLNPFDAGLLGASF